MTENTALDQAETMLAEIRDITGQLAGLEEKARAEIEAVSARYAPLTAPLKDRLAELDRRVKKHLRSYCADIFDGRDKIEVSGGYLLYGRGSRVTIPRNALEQIEALGWLEAVKVVKSVNRPVVESWPDEKLAAIGAERKIKETYSYEVKNG